MCSSSEVDLLKNYLRCTPVASHIIPKINRGAKVEKGVISNLEYLGNLKTIFSEICKVKSQEQGQEKFLVKQVLDILKRHDENKNKDLHLRIEHYEKLYAYNELELIITLLGYKNKYMIVDGNARAIAVYNYHTEKTSKKLKLPVYLVTPSFT